jgi:hypothetical protein
MEAGHENSTEAWPAADVNRTDGDDLTWVWAQAKVLVGLAVHFTSQAGNAARLVVSKDVGAH